MADQVKVSPAPAVLPPDERFWVRYSPHHEAPLSGMTSLFLHGLVVGLLLIVGFLMNLRWHGDEAKPPRMDAAMIEGGGGFDGIEGLGGPAGLPGQEQRTELAPSTVKSDAPAPKLDAADLQLENAPSVDIFLPDAELPPAPEPKDLLSELEQLTQQAKAAPAATKSVGGASNPKGVGGRGGSGNAPGPGRGKKGLGTGGGGPGGPATKAQILAWRWRFDLSGDGKIHAEKLAAVGVTLALLDVRNQYWVIRDLDKRPVDMRRENMQAYKDAVKWYNTKHDSIFALSRELQLPFVPQHVVLLLPKDREQKMAAAEAQYAQQQRRDLASVQATWFDFRVSGGDFEPVVIKME